MNKVLIKLYVPTIEKVYDIWIPINKRVYNIEKWNRINSYIIVL